MADDDIDVEGEFDLKTELGDEFYDVNELPSKSANLLPEFTSPAWMLEQGWSLDSCMDEKSKATIEKMLLEEQQYMFGKKTSRLLDMKKNVLLSTAGSSKPATPNKTPWTQEEKNLFLRGMGMFGRSWSKIAGLIPSRTSLQVKNYAQQYMKNLVKKKAEMEKTEMETLRSMTETPLFTPESPSLAATVASVTTGRPTISVTTSPTSKLHIHKISANHDSDIQTKAYGKQKKKINSQDKKAAPLNTVKPPKNLVKRTKSAKKPKKSNSFVQNGVVAYSDVSETVSGDQETNLIKFVANKFKNTTWQATSSASNMDSNSTATNGSSDVSNSSSLKDAKMSGVEEEDTEVDIDIENDDNENPVLLSRSASPSSVYHQLLKSAHIEQVQSRGHSPVPESSVFTNGHASDDVSEAEEFSLNNDDSDHPDSVQSSDKFSEPAAGNDHLDEFLELSDREKQELDEEQAKAETIVNGVIAASGETMEFEIPQEEKVFHPLTITEEEKRVHSDFFDGRPPKTPERYLKIRSYIIDCWLKSKPVYLNKTCIRPGLKNCGDVNCIGRIHSYLECVGAINFGCDQAVYKNPHRNVGGGTNSRVRGINKELIAYFPVSKSDSVRPRKRRIRDETGLWVDEKELEGKTVDHNIEIKKCETVRRTKAPRSSKMIYDPFKLVPCQPFSSELEAPYEIEVYNTALATMDIHAHISKTEVIGMLGGRFCPEALLLTISMAVPCKSMSTGMQCEMDPVSQTLASEQIESVGMCVVGWYHSHPTFSPDPSVRDIETQQKFQYWFSKGGSHFVGVIISPYNTSSPHVYSDIQCLTISKTYSKDYLCNLPFKFDYKVIYRDNLREILGPSSELAEKYSNYVNRVMLSCPYKSSLGITCLSKMLQSVKRLLIPPDDSMPHDSAAASSHPHTPSESDPKLPILPSGPATTSVASSSCSSSSWTPLPVSRSKLEEVLHWLEQIFLDKFSHLSPRSPPLVSLSSPPHLSAGDLDQSHSDT